MPQPEDSTVSSPVMKAFKHFLEKVPGLNFLNSAFSPSTQQERSREVTPETTSENAPEHVRALPLGLEFTPQSTSRHTPDFTLEHTPEHVLETEEKATEHKPENAPSSSSSAQSWNAKYETYRSLPKPQFPIRISDAGPQPVSLGTLERWVRWEYDDWIPGAASEATWRIAPDLQLIKLAVRPALELLGMDGSTIGVAHMSEGGFNKVYTVTTCDQASGCSQVYVFRIPLPICPYYKMESEVAVTEYMRNFTDIPVPKVYVYDSTSNNVLGLEWMLMETAVGYPLAGRWIDMSNESHVSLIQKIADWQDELVQTVSSEIGGLYMRWTNSDLEFFVGPSVHHVFWRENRSLYEANCGLFKSIQQFVDDIQYQESLDPLHQPPLWLDKVRGQDDEAYYAEIKREFPGITDQDAKDYFHKVERGIPSRDLEYVRLTVNSLREALPRICPPGNVDVGDASLTHPDLSLRNVLVDADGRITAVLDWERTGFLPLEMIHLYPKLIQSEDVTDSQETYWAISDDKPAFWNHVEREISEKIQTRLRPVYKDALLEMESPLIECEDEEGFWYELFKRSLNVMWNRYDAARWVKRQMEYEKEQEELARMSAGVDVIEIDM